MIDAVEKLPAKSFIVDGEMIAPEPDGTPNFHQMHSRMTYNAELMAFVAFDIMHLDGQDLRPLPAIARPSSGISSSRHRGHPVFRACRGGRCSILPGGRENGPRGHGLEETRQPLPQRTV